MNNDVNSAVVVLLANDALEATSQQAAQASVLLIDAAISILVSCHRGDAARELAGMFSNYVVEQVNAVAGGAA